MLLKSEGKSAYSLALRFFRNNYYNSFKNEKYFREFPGGKVVKTLLPSAGSAGSIPGWGAKISHASQGQKNQNVKKRQYCYKFKNGPH